MKPRTLRPRVTAVLAAALLAASVSATAPAQAAQEPVHLQGTLSSGATYVIDVPAGWNGTVLLFSHGYRPAGAANPAQDAPDDTTQSLLLGQGYALAGSSYATTGWAVEQAVPDQLAALDTFTEKVGKARRTIAWGQSYGGLVTTTIAERHPDRIDGSLSTCGLLQGGVANWNSTLDPVFALKTLLAPGTDIPLAGLGDAATATTAANSLTDVVSKAQDSATGRARIALAAALHNIPGWNDPAQTRPAPTDYEAQQANQYQALAGLIATPAFRWRQEAESRAGGNMSWNTGVDYAAMLSDSSGYQEVKALYKASGLSLKGDLDQLEKAPRVNADPSAVNYMVKNVAFTGKLRKPQLDIHTTGDPLIPVQATSAHRRAVTASGASALLRQAYVENAGHCTFTPAEQVAALHKLDQRITTGHWGDTSAAALNAEARRIDAGATARYLTYRPDPYPRPFDLAHPTDGDRQPQD
ncbi:alpha/beta fold hydrolase [Streptomyces sp. NPDC048430]|uniref:alpha/beta hydrolase family protein n=1 Tax=Streptomyces sp. NPDC048430 TaxID=3155388 RepID=UPI003448663F